MSERNEVAYFSAFDIFYGVVVPNCLFFQLEELGETVHNCARRKADCLDLTVKKFFLENYTTCRESTTDDLFYSYII